MPYHAKTVISPAEGNFGQHRTDCFSCEGRHPISAAVSKGSNHSFFITRLFGLKAFKFNKKSTFTKPRDCGACMRERFSAGNGRFRNLLSVRRRRPLSRIRKQETRNTKGLHAVHIV